MATTSHSVFDEANSPPMPSIPLLPDPVDVDETSSALRPNQDGESRIDAGGLRAQAREAKGNWQPSSEQQRSVVLTAKWKAANRSIVEACRTLSKANRSHTSAALELLADRSALLYQAVSETKAALKAMDQLPQVIRRDEHCVPRIHAAAQDFLEAVRFDVQSRDLPVFFAALQEDFFFKDAELSALRSCLQLILLEQVGARAEELVSAPRDSAEPASDALEGLLRSLSELNELDWKVVFETLSETDHILRQDPAGTYARMDAETRDRYHTAVAKLADRSSWTEVEIAREAVRLAGSTRDFADPRARERRTHVGYYLIDRGQTLIKEAAGYNATLTDRIRTTLRRWPTFFYLSAITWISCGILAAVAVGAGASTSHRGGLAVILLIVLIPVTECAIAITNLLITHLLRPERLPRMDFSAAIPDECSTLVAIPILITSEKQVRQAVKDLEIRYLGNRDGNLHFALVTDLPDSLYSFDKKDILAGLCSSLIEELNEKYSWRDAGSFIHLHRHRAYNFAEKVWMGWERKRGKMLDLNALLLNQADRFPVKAGNLAVLSTIRYVITLDQDTQILTDSARKLVGALAHPLNRAVVDPITNRVVEGYAILQPRVAVSVKSARRSRLAGIFSGDSYFDIYTQAVSDVYQDLFEAGIFTGKGIYEVAIFQKVLENRFPCNTILSHDLIEGAHARAGFISDIELVDDYPSHVSAYTRRKHRWVRGDWQIILWLFSRVPESLGKLVPNPLSVISRWQILDNLRRSLSEVSTFALLLCGWMLWPRQAFFWTMTALILAASPICLDFFVSLLGAGRNLFTASFWKDATADLAAKCLPLLCRVALLCHQSLIAMDAVVRTTVRITVTHRRLLQWETAAQAELSPNSTAKDSVERYLTWTVPASIAITGLMARFIPSSLWIALPFLMLWGTSKVFCDWLSMPYPVLRGKIGAGDQSALRHMALRTWRFFHEFCTEEENFLIPDVVQAEPPIVVHAASTTNLGFLLNAQLAAHDLGFVTLSRFATTAERTLGTISKLPTHNGHFYNWYDTQTLQPCKPHFISTVDNGNFVCCLWTLKGACAELKAESLFPTSLRLGILAHFDAIESGLPANLESETISKCMGDLRNCVDLQELSQSEWLKTLTKIAARAACLERLLDSCAPGTEAAWWSKALSSQVRDIQEMVLDFTPWLSQEFADLHTFGDILWGLPDAEELTPETILPVLTDLRAQLTARLNGAEIREQARPPANLLSQVLSRSIEAAQKMLARLSSLGAVADRLADAQDFSMFYNPHKGLLSIGYDAEAQRLWDCHYDLLASEARAAFFVAIAKGDVPQKVWFRAGRTMAFVSGKSGMLSWTGTMFEYLLPALWMKFFPDTLLEQAAQAAVLSHRKYATEKSIPWGISECSCANKGTSGRYEYRAVGVPELALSRVNPDDLVVSPYSAFLALMIDGPAAVRNLREMQGRGWLGAYGFCDAYDFTADRLRPGHSCEIVACWMAHHQGMSMVAAANALNSNVMQRRFHAEPMVTATDHLLQEASRNASEPLAEESSRLDWLKSSIPVLRNFWQSAIPPNQNNPCFQPRIECAKLVDSRETRSMSAQPKPRKRSRISGAVVGSLLLLAGIAPVARSQAPRETISIDASRPTHPFPHYWEQMFGSGRAILSLRDSYRQDLRLLKSATAVRYVRFHAIFHDEVGVYDEDATGKPVYNFSYVDQIYDGLLAEGVKPFVELSFMPARLSAQPPVFHTFWYKPIVSPPKDWAKWDDLISHFARHLVERYGIEEVSQWYFEVWNEPNIDFWAGNPQEETYNQLYDETARTLKSVDPRLRVGGPATAQAAWIDRFIRHTVDAGAPLDFVSTHVYGNDTAQHVFGTAEQIPRTEMVCRAARMVHDQVRDSPRPDLPIIWSEYNASFLTEPAVTDSTFMGPWLANTIRQCDGLMDMLSYWTFSDVFEEQGVIRTPFYGGYGLIAEGHIPKPAFNAFYLLHRLGNLRIDADSSSTLVTRTADGGLAVAVWNLRLPEAPGVSKDITLAFRGLAGTHQVGVSRLDAEHGSVLPAYDAMGRPAYPTQSQIAKLRDSALLPPPKTTSLHDGKLELTLPPDGLVLIELR